MKKSLMAEVNEKESWSAEDRRSELNDGLKDLVVVVLEEARSKHLIDCLHDDYLNDDYHVEITLTVGEIAKAARSLGIDDF